MRILIITALACACAFGQVELSLTGIGTVNMSSATSTRPVKTGTATPGTCTVGEMFFDTDATAGQNLYNCTATNTWTQVAGTTSASGLTDCAITRTSATVLTIPTCTWAPVNTAKCTITNAVITLSGGTGSALVWLNPDCSMSAGKVGTVTLSGCTNCTDAGVVTDFPTTGVRRLAKWDVDVSTTWNSAITVDYRTLVDGPLVLEDTSTITWADGTNGAKAAAINSASVQTRVNDQSGVDNYCAATGTDTMTCSLSFTPGSYTTGMVLNLKVATTNTSTTPTINVNSLGAKTLVTSANAALTASQLVVGQHYRAVYDGTNFRVDFGSAAAQALISDVPTYVELVDEFQKRSVSTAGVGELLWVPATASGAVALSDTSVIKSDSTEPGYGEIRFPAGTSGPAQQGVLYMRGGTGVSSGHTGIQLNDPSWMMRVRVRISDPTYTGVYARFDLRVVLATAADGIDLRYTQGTDSSKWTVYSQDVKVLESTLGPTANTWQWITITSTAAGALSLQVDSETPVTVSGLTLETDPVAPDIVFGFPASTWASDLFMSVGRWEFRRTR
jgi:hypothetical protein